MTDFWQRHFDIQMGNINVFKTTLSGIWGHWQFLICSDVLIRLYSPTQNPICVRAPWKPSQVDVRKLSEWSFTGRSRPLLHFEALKNWINAKTKQGCFLLLYFVCLYITNQWLRHEYTKWNDCMSHPTHLERTLNLNIEAILFIMNYFPVFMSYLEHWNIFTDRWYYFEFHFRRVQEIQDTFYKRVHWVC